MKAMLGLSVVVDQVVERAILGEEILDQRVALAACLVQKADIAARAESPAAFLVAATNGHRQQFRIVLPCQQGCPSSRTMPSATGH